MKILAQKYCNTALWRWRMSSQFNSVLSMISLCFRRDIVRMLPAFFHLSVPESLAWLYVLQHLPWHSAPWKIVSEIQVRTLKCISPGLCSNISEQRSISVSLSEVTGQTCEHRLTLFSLQHNIAHTLDGISSKFSQAGQFVAEKH